MGVSSIAVQQREQEAKKLRFFLTYSLVGSTVFHAVALAAIAMFWDKQPALADKPIEIMFVEAPPPEIPKPEAKIQPPPPPKPKPVVTPTLPPPTPPKIPELVQPKKLTEPLPQKLVEPPKPAVIPSPEPILPEPKPIPTQRQQPVAAPKPLTVPSEKPQPFQKKISEPTPAPSPIEEPPSQPQPEAVKQPVPPQLAETKPLTVPSENPKPFTERLNDPTPVESPLEDTPALPQSVAVNRAAPPQRPIETSRPLSAPAPESKPFKDILTGTNSPESTEIETSDSPPTVPGRVAVNRSAAPQRPVASSRSLSSSSGSRQGRPSFSSSDITSEAFNPGDDSSIGSPTVPGRVAVNRSAPQRPVASSRSLSSSPGSRQGRPSFSNPDSTSDALNPGDDSLVGSPTVPGRVAVNRSAPQRPVATSRSLSNSSGSRQGRPSFSSSDSTSDALNPGDDALRGSPGVPGRVAINRAAPPRPVEAPESGAEEGEIDGSELNCLSSCKPEYPRHLKDRGIEGRPVVRFMVDRNGRPTNLQVAETSGNNELDRAAMNAVQKMRFAPPNGRRTLPGRVVITFTIQD